MAYSFDQNFAHPSGVEGATLTASVVSRDGTALASQPAYTIAEDGGGLYAYYTDAMPDGHRGRVIILEDGRPLLSIGISPQETENADVKTSTRLADADYTAPPSVADVLAAGDIDGYSLEDSLKLILSGLAGVLSGAPDGPIQIEAADGSKVRIEATVDGDGNRTAIVLDATG